MARQAQLTRRVLPIAEDGRRDLALYRLELSGVACLEWEEISGEVYSMRTAPEHRRNGWMRRLWEEAHQIRPIAHSSWRTDDGDAFARAVGGPLPPRRHA